MTIEHSAITDPQIHEPKGVATAAVGSIYKALGTGSGTWQLADATMINGLAAGDGGVAGKAVQSTGSNTFKYVTIGQYGNMSLNTNTNAFSVAAAADTTLNTNSQYVLFTGTGAPWINDLTNGVTFSVDRLTVPVAGVYRVDSWFGVAGFPSNTAKIAIKFRVNGATFSVRKIMANSDTAGDVENMSAFSLISLSAGDYIQMMVASTVAGSLTISDANVMLTLLKAS